LSVANSRRTRRGSIARSLAARSFRPRGAGLTAAEAALAAPGGPGASRPQDSRRRRPDLAV